jgi:hypothetical protein
LCFFGVELLVGEEEEEDERERAESQPPVIMKINPSEFMMIMEASVDLPFLEHIRLIQLMRSVREPSDDLCLDQPAGQALYLMARSVSRAAEHLHDVRRQSSKFNASGLPLLPLPPPRVFFSIV